MPSKRTEILTHIKNKIENAELFDGPIFTSQDVAYSLEELPCALLLISKERQEVFAESAPRILKKTAEVTLQMIAEHAEGCEEELHDVFTEIEKLIFGDDTLGDRVSRVLPDSIEFVSLMQGERPIASGKLNFQVIYYEPMSRNENLPNLSIVSQFNLETELANGTQ